MKEIKDVSKEIMFKNNKKFLEELSADWKEINIKLERLEAFDSKNLIATSHISKTNANSLREDVPSDENNQTTILGNATTSGKSVVLPKVVGND